MASKIVVELVNLITRKPVLKKLQYRNASQRKDPNLSMGLPYPKQGKRTTYPKVDVIPAAQIAEQVNAPPIKRANISSTQAIFNQMRSNHVEMETRPTHPVYKHNPLAQSSNARTINPWQETFAQRQATATNKHISIVQREATANLRQLAFPPKKISIETSANNKAKAQESSSTQHTFASMKGNNPVTGWKRVNTDTAQLQQTVAQRLANLEARKAAVSQTQKIIGPMRQTLYVAELPKHNYFQNSANKEYQLRNAAEHPQRSDEIYYKMKDKCQREYQQTWVESFPEIRKQPVRFNDSIEDDDDEQVKYDYMKPMQQTKQAAAKKIAYDDTDFKFKLQNYKRY